MMNLHLCASSVWGRASFLHNGWYGAMFWIFAEHRIDNRCFCYCWAVNLIKISKEAITGTRLLATDVGIKHYCFPTSSCTAA